MFSDVDGVARTLSAIGEKLLGVAPVKLVEYCGSKTDDSWLL